MVRQRDLIRASLPCEKKRALCDDFDCNACFNKSFASSIPKTISIVDKKINPRFIPKYSKNELFFRCSVCKHTFDKSIKSLTDGEYCIYCTTKPVKLCGEEHCDFCFKKSFASYEKAKYWNYKKNKLKPIEVYLNSLEKIHIDCDKRNHTFESTPKRINEGHFCLYCANLKICDDSNCYECLKKSFVTHPLALSWSIKNDVLPHQVFKNSTSQKYYFDCKKCKHKLHMILGSLDENTNNCIYCAGKKLCDYVYCKPCFNKSFASSSFAKYWSKKNKVEPRDITRNSHKKYWFDCPKCNHEFETTPSHIDENKANCVYCASQKMCYEDDCNFCFDKSFASHEKSKYWSDKNKLKPREVFKSTDSKYFFDCNFCNEEFNTSLASVKRGNWCSLCVNKTEKMLKDWLDEKYGKDNVKTQYIVHNGDKKYLFDFYLPNLNLIIELDGLQHFKQVGNWKSPEDALKNDINKINLSIQLNLSIIRILQEDVYYDRNDWDTKLLNCIQRYDTPKCIFIDNENLYKKHIDGIDKNINIMVL
jgi:very-short-patch-repair endonuclease